MFLFSLPVGLQGGSKETSYQTSRTTNHGTSTPTSRTTNWTSHWNTNYLTGHPTIATTSYSTATAAWNTSRNTTTSWNTTKVTTALTAEMKGTMAHLVPGASPTLTMPIPPLNRYGFRFAIVMKHNWEYEDELSALLGEDVSYDFWVRNINTSPVGGDKAARLPPAYWNWLLTKTDVDFNRLMPNDFMFFQIAIPAWAGFTGCLSNSPHGPSETLDQFEDLHNFYPSLLYPYSGRMAFNRQTIDDSMYNYWARPESGDQARKDNNLWPILYKGGGSFEAQMTAYIQAQWKFHSRPTYKDYTGGTWFFEMTKPMDWWASQENVSGNSINFKNYDVSIEMNSANYKMNEYASEGAQTIADASRPGGYRYVGIARQYMHFSCTFSSVPMVVYTGNNVNTSWNTDSGVSTSKSTVTTFSTTTSWTTNHQTTITTQYTTSHPTSTGTSTVTSYTSNWTTTYVSLYNTSHITYG